MTFLSASATFEIMQYPIIYDLWYSQNSTTTLYLYIPVWIKLYGYLCSGFVGLSSPTNLETGNYNVTIYTLTTIGT